MARIPALLYAVLAYLTFVAQARAAAAAADFSIGDILNLLQLGLVDHINAFITLDSLSTDQIEVNVDVKNPLPLEMTIDRIVSKAGLNGTIYSEFDKTFETPVVVPLLGSANTGSIFPVKLVQGALASLDIIPFGILDLISTDVYLRVATIHGKLGIPLPITGLKQDSVPTTYTLQI